MLWCLMLWCPSLCCVGSFVLLWCFCCSLPCVLLWRGVFGCGAVVYPGAAYGVLHCFSLCCVWWRVLCGAVVCCPRAPALCRFVLCLPVIWSLIRAWCCLPFSPVFPGSSGLFPFVSAACCGALVECVVAGVPVWPRGLLRRCVDTAQGSGTPQGTTAHSRAASHAARQEHLRQDMPEGKQQRATRPGNEHPVTTRNNTQHQTARTKVQGSTTKKGRKQQPTTRQVAQQNNTAPPQDRTQTTGHDRGPGDRSGGQGRKTAQRFDNWTTPRTRTADSTTHYTKTRDGITHNKSPHRTPHDTNKTGRDNAHGRLPATKPRTQQDNAPHGIQKQPRTTQTSHQQSTAPHSKT